MLDLSVDPISGLLQTSGRPCLNRSAVHRERWRCISWLVKQLWNRVSRGVPSDPVCRPTTSPLYGARSSLDRAAGRNGGVVSGMQAAIHQTFGAFGHIEEILIFEDLLDGVEVSLGAFRVKTQNRGGKQLQQE